MAYREEGADLRGGFPPALTSLPLTWPRDAVRALWNGSPDHATARIIVIDHHVHRCLCLHELAVRP